MKRIPATTSSIKLAKTATEAAKTTSSLKPVSVRSNPQAMPQTNGKDSNFATKAATEHKAHFVSDRTNLPLPPAGVGGSKLRLPAAVEQAFLRYSNTSGSFFRDYDPSNSASTYDYENASAPIDSSQPLAQQLVGFLKQKGIQPEHAEQQQDTEDIPAPEPKLDPRITIAGFNEDESDLSAVEESDTSTIESTKPNASKESTTLNSVDALAESAQELLAAIRERREKLRMTSDTESEASSDTDWSDIEETKTNDGATGSNRASTTPLTPQDPSDAQPSLVKELLLALENAKSQQAEKLEQAYEAEDEYETDTDDDIASEFDPDDYWDEDEWDDDDLWTDAPEEVSLDTMLKRANIEEQEQDSTEVNTDTDETELAENYEFLTQSGNKLMEKSKSQPEDEENKSKLDLDGANNDESEA